MKNRNLYSRIIPVLFLLGCSFVSRSQVLAQWTFNNLLSGLGSASIITSNATLGPGIPTQDYNGGTVFFGEGGWPAGDLDPTAYLEFTVKPVTAFSLTVASMQMNIRRSTTGSGAGPNNWSLRSSLDNYTTDISSGILSMSSTAAIPVTFNSSFAHLSTPVTFRLYGYNVTMTAGGLNRFVFDNISIGGATVLPVSFGSLTAEATGNSVNLGWTIPADQSLFRIQVQRSVAGGGFLTLASLSSGQGTYQYSDNGVGDGTYDYRIAMTTTDGDTTFSPVDQVQIHTADLLSVQGISSTSGDVRVRITAPAAGAYRLTLYNMNGYPVASENPTLSAGTQTVAIGSGRPVKGIYIIRAECNGRTGISRIVVP